MTQINRTPFRKVVDIPAHILTSDKLKWDSTGGGLVVLTTDGKRYAYLGPDGKIGSWWDSTDATLRPHGLSWEAAEALVNPPQPKTEEPFRPGLPPAELRAVCKEWEWRRREDRADTRFDGDKHWFVEFGESAAMRHTVTIRDNFRPLGKTWAEVEALAAAKLYRTVGEVLKAGLFDVCSHWYVKGHSEERRLGIGQERMLGTSVYMRVVKDLLTSSSGHFSADDLIRPSRVTWEALEAELAAKKSIAAPARKLTPNETSTRKHPVPIGGWVMRTDGGYHGVPFGTKAQVTGTGSTGSCYDVRLSNDRQHVWAPIFCEPCAPPEPKQEPTYIVACPKGRRACVKYYLSQHIYTGNKDLDALPYSAADKPFYMGYVSAKLREELTALAPDIRFSVG